MTLNQLIRHFNTEFSLTKPWPQTYEVDAETYANCCQAVFNKDILYSQRGSGISLGPNAGLMIKGVELIYKAQI